MTDRPVAQGRLATADGQRISWVEWGVSDGVPAVYVHGGPGGGLGSHGYRHRFDLSRTRLIGFDQRGCGLSLPHAADPATSLEANTTAHLIADMETLREARGVDRWIVNGVSWGSTLALAYAQAHPERVLGMVLFAVTTTSRAEVDWITEGVGSVYPEAWDRFASFAENAGIGYERGRGRLVEAYARLLGSDDSALRDAASHEWALWEDTHISLGIGGFRRDPRWDDDAHRLAFARLTSHYWANDGFLDPPVLECVDRLCGIDATLIHGRADVSGPVRTAWELHRRWRGSRLFVEESDGHGGAAMARRWDEANARLVLSVAQAQAPGLG